MIHQNFQESFKLDSPESIKPDVSQTNEPVRYSPEKPVKPISTKNFIQRNKQMLAAKAKVQEVQKGAL